MWFGSRVLAYYSRGPEFDFTNTHTNSEWGMSGRLTRYI